MARYILIHGAWHGGWCWEEIVPKLGAAGHTVYAPDLPGMGSDTTPFTDDPIGQWTDYTVSLIKRHSEPVILVGHSRGGVVISSVAERIPDQISTLVYVTAFLLENGKSVADEVGLNEDIADINTAQNACVVKSELHAPIFYNEMDAADAARCSRRLVPEPLGGLMTPVQVSAENFGKVPRVYIEAEFDNAIPLDLQRKFQTIWPCDPVVTLASDHSPFYSTADELAAALIALAR